MLTIISKEGLAKPERLLNNCCSWLLGLDSCCGNPSRDLVDVGISSQRFLVSTGSPCLVTVHSYSGDEKVML